MQSVNDRYLMFEEIETDAVLSLDEDAQLVTDEVSCLLHYVCSSDQLLCQVSPLTFMRLRSKL